MWQLKIFLFMFLGLALTGCGLGDLSQSPTSQENQPQKLDLTVTSRQLGQEDENIIQPTPTPNPAPIIRSSKEAPLTTDGGEIEIRIPFDIYNPSAETPDNPAPECLHTLPFTINSQNDRLLVSGEGRIQCEFIDTPVDQPITYHIILDLDGSFDGELLPSTPDYPKGFLDAFLNIGGTITQFYSGYPPEATNPCPESDPCQSPAVEVIPLPFHYEDGSQITVPWIFTLHLRQAED